MDLHARDGVFGGIEVGRASQDFGGNGIFANFAVAALEVPCANVFQQLDQPLRRAKVLDARTASSSTRSAPFTEPGLFPPLLVSPICRDYTRFRSAPAQMKPLPYGRGSESDTAALRNATRLLSRDGCYGAATVRERSCALVKSGRALAYQFCNKAYIIEKYIDILKLWFLEELVTWL